MSNANTFFPPERLTYKDLEEVFNWLDDTVDNENDGDRAAYRIIGGILSALQAHIKSTGSFMVPVREDMAQPAGRGEVASLDLRVVVNEYFQFRGYADPDATQALLFLTSEIGELADRFVHTQSKWVRNNPENKSDDVAGEIGDVLMMLTKFAERAGVDPIRAMLEKFKKKGFKGGLPNEYARVLVPDYVHRSHFDNRDGEYAPWVVTAPDPKMLTNEVLDHLYTRYMHIEAHENDDPEDFSNFMEYLDTLPGYDVKNVEEPGIWIPY
jgi:NTP pyrophosphatase (non-canonical NTP hydrolase)